jgi:hypothetical protein
MVVMAAVVFAALSAGQTPTTIFGVVMDGRGAPISGAVIDHTGVQGSHEADGLGRFDLQVRGPTVVVRGPGYESHYLKLVNASGNLRVTLEPATRSLPVCARNASCSSHLGAFCFPQVPGVSVPKPGRDVDYIAESFIANEKRALHGVGPNWSYGVPWDRDVWNSTEYHENVYLRNGFNIVDARGSSGPGRYWHYLGIVGESAEYHDVDQTTAALLDRVLDGVCLLPLKK